MYAIYLRKSRADREAEARGEGETLSRHEKTLSGLAAGMKLPVGAIYKEIVSGETISARPLMQRLLIEVMQGKWEGVLVMEVERLARGDTKDQGTVAEAFKFSNTKIITPSKTFDPSNEFDEEYFEFNLFMSRREYKTINRRIQRGRIAAFNDGWYISGTAPYGYQKIKKKENKGYTLEIISEEAEVVRLIYDLYTNGERKENGALLPLSSGQISDRINRLQIPSPTGKKWSASSVIDILNNPVYAGYQRWSRRKTEKKIVDGMIVESRPLNGNYKKIKGRFQPVITEEQYEQAKRIRSGRFAPKTGTNTLKNPLSGLIYCARCGSLMTRAGSNTRTNYHVLRCPNRDCDNVSAPLDLVEQKLLTGLSVWLPGCKLNWPEEVRNAGASLATIRAMEESAYIKTLACLTQAEEQISSTYEFLERGIYDIDTFQERRRILEEKRFTLAREAERLSKSYKTPLAREQASKDSVPGAIGLIEVYLAVSNVTVKNKILKELLYKAEYLKTVRNRKGKRDTANFTLHIYPRIPKIT